MKTLFTRALMGLALVGAVAGTTGCMATPEGGEVIVVRNGGPFDDRQIREVVPNGAGNSWVGWMSEPHPYPASDQQRLYKFDDSPDADAKPVEVPTKDGVRVRLTGTFYINTAFDGTPEGEKLVQTFDTSFGTRAFTGSNSDGTYSAKPWEDGGWTAFLNSVLQPVIDSNVREVIAEFDCKQLVSSCALVQRGGNVNAQTEEVTNTKSNVTLIQDRINENLAEEIQAKLTKPYFKNIRFSLGPVELPGVQKAIDTAQSAFAEVSRAQARVAQAKADADANEERQRGYNNCPACQRIDAIKALPPGLTALGGEFAVAVK
jgi:regulator of protease activity HflC (stomatin/prohibitin superfamily)